MIDEKFPYLFSNSYVVYDNDMECIQFGLELTRDAKSQEEKARAIYDWIARNVKYDFSVVGKLEAGYVPNPQKTYDTKLGICTDFAALFASMCRSQGIPCKLVVGNYERSEYLHAWNEVYFDGEYHIVDASGDSQTERYDFIRTDGYQKEEEH
jgi:transglutaminase-like putative cysteine protease